ncbi:4665_t:CDS:1, partial [Paraglomus occultum]
VTFEVAIREVLSNCQKSSSSTQYTLTPITSTIASRIAANRKRKIYDKDTFKEEFPDLTEDEDIKDNMNYYPSDGSLEFFEPSLKKAKITIKNPSNFSGCSSLEDA